MIVYAERGSSTSLPPSRGGRDFLVSDLIKGKRADTEPRGILGLNYYI